MRFLTDANLDLLQTNTPHRPQQNPSSIRFLTSADDLVTFGGAIYTEYHGEMPHEPETAGERRNCLRLGPQQLWDDLPQIRVQVAKLESPNPDDDHMVKIAIVGYSYHQPTTSWGRDEFDFIMQRRREVADFGERWVEFVCLASGYLLGLHQAGRCGDAEFLLLEAQLPGFMWQYSERFTGAPDAAADRDDG